MKARADKGREIERWFDSSYGSGAVAVYGDLLLLKYGIGRGTCARDEHVKVYKFTRESLEEVCDVQTSYYVNVPHRTSPDRVDYQVKAARSKGHTVLTFRTGQARHGVPWEKIVMVRNG